MTFCIIKKHELIKCGYLNAMVCCQINTTDFFYRDKNCHDARHSYHIHGLCCCLQVRKHRKWGLHANITQYHNRGYGKLSHLNGGIIQTRLFYLLISDHSAYVCMCTDTIMLITTQPCKKTACYWITSVNTVFDAGSVL